MPVLFDPDHDAELLRRATKNVSGPGYDLFQGSSCFAWVDSLGYDRLCRNPPMRNAQAWSASTNVSI
eukprot:scaffold129159_cov16-Tisochrysis_lutea.AAC.1